MPKAIYLKVNSIREAKAIQDAGLNAPCGKRNGTGYIVVLKKEDEEHAKKVLSEFREHQVKERNNAIKFLEN